MKIATYNVNGINARLPVLLKWLEETKPDIACLQELKAPLEKIPMQAIEDAGYQALWHGQKSWNGVAMLSRGELPVERCRVLPGDEEDVQSRFIEAEINGMIICGLYLPNGNPVPGPKYDYKLSWMERFKSHVKDLYNEKKPVILTGDFNVIPTDIDVYKPERWTEDALFRIETRKSFAELMEQGWTDALRELHPDEVIYTFFDFFRNTYGRNAGLRIDHFLLNEAATKLLKSAEVDNHVRGWEKSSDHCPVWIELS